jgi:tRNA(Ile)-lysidine synthase
MLHNNSITEGRTKARDTQLRKKKTSSTLARVTKAIKENRLIGSDDQVIVGISGGSDSTGLLHILARIFPPSSLIAVYIDHNLRPTEAIKESETVKGLCRDLGIDSQVIRVDVSGFILKTRKSTEEAARILRYQALEKVRMDFKAECIAVAHTADDQVEEFYLRLIRGSGSRGLSGMSMKKGVIVRPLLGLAKTEIENYLREHHIGWCVDSSNSNRSFLRNRVRHSLLPFLENEFSPSIRRQTLRVMDILAEEESLLEDLSEKAYQQCVSISESCESAGFQRDQYQSLTVTVDLLCLMAQHLACRRRIVEKCFWQLSIPPSYDKISEILELSEADTAKELHLTDGVRVVKRAADLFFSRPLGRGQLRGTVVPPVTYSLEIVEPGKYALEAIGKLLELRVSKHCHLPEKDGANLVLDLAAVNFPLIVRGAKPGERFRPFNGSGSKKISRYFTEQKIPRQLRSSWPILFSGEKVVALAGLEIDDQFRVSETTATILIIKLSDLQQE